MPGERSNSEMGVLKDEKGFVEVLRTDDLKFIDKELISTANFYLQSF